MPTTTMTKGCACQHPAISGLAGGQGLDQLADVAAGSTASVALAASRAVVARFARTRPLSRLTASIGDDLGLNPRLIALTPRSRPIRPDGSTTTGGDRGTPVARRRVSHPVTSKIPKPAGTSGSR